MNAVRILHSDADGLAGSFVGSRYFGGLRGSEAMRHLTRKYFNLLLLSDHYRKSAATATRLPSIKCALDVVLARMTTLNSERLAA